MKLSELRPHLVSRVAHELKYSFLNDLIIDLKNRILTNDDYIRNTYHSPELLQQAAAIQQPHVLMDELFKVAQENAHNVVIKSTKPKGYHYTQIATPSCHVVILRKHTNNTKNARFFQNEALLNEGLMAPQQPDLLDDILSSNNENPLSSLLFICIEIAWNSEQEILDIDFNLPHPTEHYRLIKFSAEELIEAASKPKTEEAEEDIVSLKKRIIQANPEK